MFDKFYKFQYLYLMHFTRLSKKSIAQKKFKNSCFLSLLVAFCIPLRELFSLTPASIFPLLFLFFSVGQQIYFFKENLLTRLQHQDEMASALPKLQ